MNSDPVELERQADRALRRLPVPRAPGTLVGRVMAASAAIDRRPWYARAWRSWPGSLQAASVIALAAGVATAVAMAPAALELARQLPWTARLPLPSTIAEVALRIESAWAAWQVIWRVVVEPVAGGLVLFVLAMSVACVLFGTALERVVALGGVAKS